MRTAAAGRCRHPVDERREHRRSRGWSAAALQRVFERMGQPAQACRAGHSRQRRQGLAAASSRRCPSARAIWTSSSGGRCARRRRSAIEDAQLSYVPGLKAADGSTEFVVVMARTRHHPRIRNGLRAAGAQAGIVDLSTFNVINAVLAGPGAPPSDDWLLVHVTHEDATMAILRGRHLVFFRNRTADGEGESRGHGASDGHVLRRSPERRRVQPRGARGRRIAGRRRARTPNICGARSSSGSAPGSTRSIRGARRR